MQKRNNAATSSRTRANSPVSRPPLPPLPKGERSAERRGSVLIVVLGLLLLLLLLGFTFFSFATQEQASAEYYANAAKNFEPELDSDLLWDWALDQLIVGPSDTYQQSVLWPGRHSLVPNAIGMMSSNAQGKPVAFDLQPFNGIGVNVISGPGGAPWIDQNYDGVNDAIATPISADLFNINVSQYMGYTRQHFLYPSSFPGTPPFSSIDVGYTYPDINNVFLAHVGMINGVQVVTPSFHRPQYLRDGSGVPDPLWYQNPARVGHVLCPHPNHLNVADGATPRYVTNPAGITVGTHTILPFVFAINGNGTAPSGQQGVWTGGSATANLLDYPCDNDNDGIPEGVWVDLGFPVQTLPDGRKYVPLFSYTVVDVDGLVNVNLHGNLAGFASLAKPFSGTPDPISAGPIASISRSNLGVSATEVNPWWPLTADPNDLNYLNPNNSTVASNALQQYRGFFGLNKTTPTGSTGFVIDRSEMANMDLLFMLWGRPKYDATASGSGPESFTINDLVPGRWGERNILLAGGSAALSGGPTSVSIANFPRPGTSGADDDNDIQAGSNDTFYEPLLGGLALLPNGFPMDNFGSGIRLQTIGVVRAATLVADQNNNQSPVRYPLYHGYAGGSQLQNFSTILSSTPAGWALVRNPDINGQIDEGDEVTVDRRYVQTYGQNDHIFGPDEMAGLHLSQGDFTTTLLSSRLRQLMPFNFELNIQAQSIRKRFTTDSWDRRQHGFAWCNYPPAAGAVVPRGQWEYGADWDSNGVSNEFPPAILPAALGTAAQPFRHALAAVIGTKTVEGLAADPTVGTFPYAAWYQQVRLNINRLLTSTNPLYQANTALEDYVNRPLTAPTAATPNLPAYRQLTPHSATVPATPVPSGASAPITFDPATFTANPQFQEYWARVDRQKMARDIYVMLYMFGGGNDSVDYTTANADAGPDTIHDPGNTLGLRNRTLYSDYQLREMAQFAVNVVDALDRDEVFTRFEYDKDLSNGWGLDDNPYTTIAAGTEMGPIAAIERDEVWGVEAQSLTISEVLAVRCPRILSTNHNATAFNDMDADRYFTYVELRNVSPYTVDLQNSAWRIRRVRAPLVGPVTAPDASVVFRFDGLNNTNLIQPNANYTIASMSRTDLGQDTFTDTATSTGAQRSADFRVDIDGDMRFDRIAPNSNIPEAQAPLELEDKPPTANLDLVHYRDLPLSGTTTKFVFIDHTSGTYGTDMTATDRGGFYRPAEGDIERLTFILERRANLLRASPAPITDQAQNDDNPWVEVDRFENFTAGTTPQVQLFGLDIADTTATLPGKLQLVLSQERSQPFDRAFGDNNNPGFVKNSLGALVNSQVLPNPIIWQPHFDRDFASVVDLLSIPLYGPDTLTARLCTAAPFPLEKIAIEGQDAAGNYEARIAQAKFLRPTHPIAAVAPAPTNNNRWYRILELLEFPNRSHRQVETSLTTVARVDQLLKRVPAKINLNGLRHPEVLFALLDDPAVFNLSLQDSLEPGRDWWLELVAARDGIDPQTTLLLPGSPASRPFRDLSFAAGAAMPPTAGPGLNTVPAIERTLARRVTLDNPDLNNNSTVDPGEENPPATPVAYNPAAGTAPRQLFEARPDSNQVTAHDVDYHTRNRLLAKVANNSTGRGNVFAVWITVGFFDSHLPIAGNNEVVQIGAEMVDQPRRRGFFLVDRTLLEDAYDSAAGTFDFRKFVQYRKTIE